MVYVMGNIEGITIDNVHKPFKCKYMESKNNKEFRYKDNEYCISDKAFLQTPTNFFSSDEEKGKTFIFYLFAHKCGSDYSKKYVKNPEKDCATPEEQEEFIRKNTVNIYVRKQ